MVYKPNWLTLLIFLLLSIYFIRVHLPAGSPDSYWHLAIGRQVWQEKQIPKVDKFVYGSPDTHFTSTEWLAGLTFYTSARYLGLNGLLVLRVAAGLGAIFFLYLTLRLTGASRLLINSTILVVGYVLAIRLDDRPEIFSLLFVSMVNYSCFYYYFRKKLPVTSYLLPIIFLLWPNIHGFTILGVVILAFWLVFLLWKKFVVDKSTGDFWPFLGMILLSIGIALVQFSKVFYFLKVKEAIIATTEMVSLLTRIAEIKYSLLAQIPIEIYVYFVILIFYLIGLISCLAKKHTADKVWIWLGFFYLLILILPFGFFRLIPIVVLTVFPQTLILTDEIFRRKLTLILAYFSRGLYLIFLFILIGSILGGYIIGNRTYRRYTYDANGRAIAVINRTWTGLFPFGAEKFIGEYLATRRLYTSDIWNNYFIWYLPTTQVFSDAMFEYRTKEDLVDERILNSGKEGWEELIGKYNIDTVVNSQSGADKPNKTPVYELANWRLVWVDSYFAIYGRDDVVKSHPVDLSALDLSLDTTLKFKDEDKDAALKQLEALLAYDWRNGFARAQLIQYYLLNDVSLAKALAEESRKLLSDDPLFSVYLAGVHATLGNCDLARQFGNEAKRKSFNDYNFRYLVAKVLSACGGMN